MSNKVIAGDFEGCEVKIKKNIPTISKYGVEQAILTKNHVESYDIINESTTKSTSSAITRGAVGAFLLGPLGLTAALSAKNKGLYLINIKWKNAKCNRCGANLKIVNDSCKSCGNKNMSEYKKSLIEVNDEIYKLIITNCF